MLFTPVVDRMAMIAWAQTLITHNAREITLLPARAIALPWGCLAHTAVQIAEPGYSLAAAARREDDIWSLGRAFNTWTIALKPQSKPPPHRPTEVPRTERYSR
jgi:hypothetical protein